MKGWKDLGVVETIYEEDHEREKSSSSLSLSPITSAPLTPLHSRVETWSLATGRKTDVLVNVQGSSFHLHKDRLALRSVFLKRLVTEHSVIYLSPPLNITAETFALVADFCYGTDPIITPFNIAALRIAAELLEMTADDNLIQITETYFCSAVAINREYASLVFRSCLPLLPEAETTACLASRCIEALSLTEDRDGVDNCIDVIKMMEPEDFEIIVNSMYCRFAGSHNLIYMIVDLYLKEQVGKITEEEKTQICNSIDCTKLSPQLLMHAVQNPRMPLRFIVRAMFIEQLDTRHSIISATDQSHPRRPTNQPRPRRVSPTDQPHPCRQAIVPATDQLNALQDYPINQQHPPSHDREREAITLGAILQRDAALRQVTQLKEVMDATTSRIRSLEKDLNDMKKKLHTSERQTSLLESVGSASFNLSSANNKIQRGERGSVSSDGLRCDASDVKEENIVGLFGSSSQEGTFTPRLKKNIRQRLMKGLKSAFGGSTTSASKEPKHQSHQNINVIKDDVASHRRSRSLTSTFPSIVLQKY